MSKESAMIEFDKLLNVFNKVPNFETFFSGSSSLCDKLPDLGVECASGCSRDVFWFEKDPEYVFKVDISFNEPYCQREYEIYQRACEEGIKEMFAEIFPVGEYAGRTFYAMQYIDIAYNKVNDDIYNKLSNQGMEEEIDSTLNGLGEYDIINELLEYYYPRYMLETFYSFAREEGINDLHSGNAGYYNDMLVLSDYCGYDLY